MKKQLYILAFTCLGLLIAVLLNSVVELYYLRLLIRDFQDYSFGMSWKDLEQFHAFFFLLLLSGCGLWGYFSGHFWWKQIYVLKKFRHKRWRKMWQID